MSHLVNDPVEEKPKQTKLIPQPRVRCNHNKHSHRELMEDGTEYLFTENNATDVIHTEHLREFIERKKKGYFTVTLEDTPMSNARYPRVKITLAASIEYFKSFNQDSVDSQWVKQPRGEKPKPAPVYKKISDEKIEVELVTVVCMLKTHDYSIDVNKDVTVRFNGKNPVPVYSEEIVDFFYNHPKHFKDIGSGIKERVRTIFDVAVRKAKIRKDYYEFYQEQIEQVIAYFKEISKPPLEPKPKKEEELDSEEEEENEQPPEEHKNKENADKPKKKKKKKK